MKTFLNKSLAFFTVALLLWGCEKSGTETIAIPGEAGTLTSSANVLILEKANQEKQATVFSFTPASFGYQAAVSNILQIGLKGTDFASAREVALAPKVTEQSYTVLELNALVLALNIPFDEASDLEVRIKSQISSSFDPIYSNVVALKVTPYPLISWVYVPGDYQGWDPSTADSLKSATGNGIYEGVIFYPNVSGATYEFKITPAKNWTVGYGDATGGKVSTTGANFKVPGSGSYKITLNLNENTYKIEPFSWGVIGDATSGGWDADTDMRYDNGNGVWKVTATLKAGAFKFRRNHDWGVNFGGSNGVLSSVGDNNIPITVAGTYTIVLDLVNNTYTLTKQ